MIDVDFEDEDLVVSMDDNIELEVKYHRELEGLDYNEAGHTGFMPSRKENLEDVDSQASNDDVELFGNDGTKPSKISVTDLQDRITILDGVKVNNTPLPIDNNKNVNIDLSDYSLGNQTVARTILNIDSSTYIVTLTTYDRDNNVINTSQIDLPVESVVVSGRYDNITKSLILVLQSGSEITIPVGDLISGLQSEITPSNKLGSDLVDDTNNVHKFVSQAQKDKLDAIESNAQVNVLEGVQVNGSDLSIDANKKVNINLTPYALKSDIASVPNSSIVALFNENNGGNE